MEQSSEHMREAREILEAKILREVLLAIKAGEDPESPLVISKIRKVQLRALNAPDCPFTQDQVQSLYRERPAILKGGFGVPRKGERRH